MLWPPKLKVPRAATPGPGLSSRSRASYGLWLTYSATPLSAGTPAGAVQRCPTLKPFSPNAAVSVSQASASVPATGSSELGTSWVISGLTQDVTDLFTDL